MKKWNTQIKVLGYEVPEMFVYDNLEASAFTLDLKRVQYLV